MDITISRLLFLLPLLTFSHLANGQNDPSELQRIDSIVHLFYKTLSFDDGEWKTAEKLEPLFFSDSRLIANFGVTPQLWTTHQYIESVRSNVVKQGMSAVEEKEIYGKTDFFGKVAQRLSTYEIRFKFKEKETVRTGINLIQLIKTGGGWKINSVVWDRESEQLKVPTQYKPK